MINKNVKVKLKFSMRISKITKLRSYDLVDYFFISLFLGMRLGKTLKYWSEYFSEDAACERLRDSMIEQSNKNAKNFKMKLKNTFQKSRIF
jgi:DNA segregation ATPase FtsK/SpoIIIE-like protein